MAKREQKPVYINNDIFNGMFRRNYDTIHGYRNSHRSLKEGHPFERLSDHEYLRSIGAAAISEEDGQLHPTAADKLILANPGYVRTGKKQMRLGGESDPQNKALMKMFNLINIGERAGSGVPNIFNVWADEGWEEPVIEERFAPDRTVLSLPFKKKVTEKGDRKNVTEKTQAHYDMILSFMEDDAWYKASELVDVLGIRETRTKALLRALVEDGLLVDNGVIKGRKYKKIKSERSL